MSELPTGWASATLPELVAVEGVLIDGDWVESKDQDPNGDVRLIQLADVGDGVYRNRSSRFLTSSKARELNCTFLRKGDVLVARMPDPLGRACLFPGDSHVSVTVVDVCIVRPGPPGAHARWLVHALNAPQMRQATAALQKGTTRKRISRGNLAQIPLPVPPLAEQERIVAAIEEQFSRLDAGIAALARATHRLKRLQASIYQAAVTGALAGADTSDWRSVPLGALLQDLHAGKSFKCEERPAGTDEWGVVKVSAMTWGEFREQENKTVLPGREIDPRLEIQPGDLLISRANTVDYVGAVVHVGACRPRLLLSDKSLRLVPVSGVLPEWLVISLRSQSARRYIEGVATGTSDSMRNISQPKLKALSVPWVRAVIATPAQLEGLSRSSVLRG